MNTANAEPFLVKDCTLLRIATGIHVQNLSEMRDKLLTIHPESIYFHYWGRKLRHVFVEPEYHNDFASWAFQSLHDITLAERLSVIDPSDSTEPEDLRAGLIEVVEKRIYECETIPSSSHDEQFHFVHAKIVVFDTGYAVTRPEELPGLIPEIPDGSVFYHFIDAARRTKSKSNDFSVWLSSFGNDYKELSERVSTIEPYFLNMRAIRERLTSILNEYLRGPTNERTG